MIGLIISMGSALLAEQPLHVKPTPVAVATIPAVTVVLQDGKSEECGPDSYTALVRSPGTPMVNTCWFVDEAEGMVQIRTIHGTIIRLKKSDFTPIGPPANSPPISYR